MEVMMDNNLMLNQNLDTDRKLGQLWSDIKRVFRILGMARVSIIMVCLSFLTLFFVGQVTDAIVALGNFGSLHHFIIFCMIGLLWAFCIWYWARVFYYIEYHKEKGLKKYEIAIIEQTPRILGVLALLNIGIAFMVQAPSCQLEGRPNPIRIIGITFLVLAVVFIGIVYFRRKIFKLGTIGDVNSADQEINGIVPIKDLPGITRKILVISTIIAVILLVLLIIFPIHLTMLLGDGVTILVGCFCIWLPLVYWIRYLSLKLRFPVFMVLFIVIAFFSLMNGNKNVRLVASNNLPDSRMKMVDYYKLWDARIAPGNIKSLTGEAPDVRKPMILVLSEGGGIRAAYWSAELLARIQKDYPKFRENLFGISGVSGGSFGATIFDSLLKYYDQHPGENVAPVQTGGSEKSIIQKKTTEIVGKDFLSPIVACMLTREVVQLIIPVPISSFDHAKVFEETWEYQWQQAMKGDNTFGEPLLSLWKDDPDCKIPPLFLNSTQVEDGYPVALSHLQLESDLPKDFYSYNLGDVRVSTASLLSARFPYVGPAGTLLSQSGKTIGLVDGGYFENTGANTAYRVLIDLKKWDESQKIAKLKAVKGVADSNAIKDTQEFQKFETNESIYRSKVKPVIIYMNNGMETVNSKTSGQTMLYQLFAPIETMLQVRDAHTVNAVSRLKEFVELYNGEFIEYSLQDSSKKDDQAAVPLGWALSKKMQDEIDDRVRDIKINELDKYFK
jgi:hypothetical protein